RDGLEGDGCRILTLLLRSHDLGACTLCPGGELLDRGGTEGVCRADDDRAIVAPQEPGELADRGGLADPVHADDQHHGWALGEVEGRVELGKALLDRLAE